MACWIALLQSKKAILAGDHLQLPPTILSTEAARKGLSLTLMERAIQLLGKGVVRMLNTQYRMNTGIDFEFSCFAEVIVFVPTNYHARRKYCQYYEQQLLLKYFSAIMNWSSNAFYDNELVAHSSVSSRLLKDLPGIKSDENTGSIQSIQFNSPSFVSDHYSYNAVSVDLSCSSFLETWLDLK